MNQDESDNFFSAEHTMNEENIHERNREIFEKYKNEIAGKDYQILDLCAGSGVVGMDLLFHQLKESSFEGEIDFLEIQAIYKNHFEKNKQTLQNCFPEHSLRRNLLPYWFSFLQVIIWIPSCGISE